MVFNTLKQRFAGNKGYTIDQTILIVAIIAILITLIIVTVGWQLINRSSGTKLGAQLKQIEDANGQFYSAQKMWPHLAQTTATATTNMLALTNGLAAAAWSTNVVQADLRNYLPGFRVVSSVVQHGFGSGGAVTQQANTAATLMGGATTDQYLVVQMASMPLSEAQEADKAIDGSLGYNTGRVVYSASACQNTAAGGAMTVPSTAATSGSVYLCYIANAIQ
jgi:Tfp pilus assembly protein PilE